MPQFQNQQRVSDSIITLESQQNEPDPDSEFIEHSYAEDDIQRLDFDNANAMHSMYEVESDFSTLDDNMTSMFDVADATDSIDDIDVLSDIDLSIDDPF